MTSPVRQWVVVCDDWTAEHAQRHRTIEAAEQRLAAIRDAGVCRLPHRVEEVTR